MTSVSAPGFIKQPTQERSRRAVRRLLEAAEERFGAEGFERASVREIAACADVPKGTLYQFFESKEGLLDALAGEYKASIDAIFSSTDDDAIARLIADGATVLEAMVRYIVDEIVTLAAGRPAFRMLFSGLAASGPAAAAGADLRLHARGNITLALVLGNPDGTTSYDRAADVCVEIVRGLLPRIVDEQGRVDASLVPELTVVLTSYLAEVKSRVD